MERTGENLALFDVIGEAARRQDLKTELGDERLPGVVSGVVVENYNKDMPGRVCVKIPVWDKDEDTLQWVPVVSPFSGSKWGQYFLPEKGDRVLLAFEGGSVEKPYVIGSIPRENDRFLKESSDEQNQKKNIMTRHGNKICFTDCKEGDGEKDKIEIHTAGESHKIIMDNEKKTILLTDKENNCRIELKTENGKMEIRAQKKITFEVGDKIKISMNGESGTVSIEAEKVSVKAGKMLEYKTDGTAKFSGQQTILEASSMMKLDSSGMIAAKGGPIKLG